MPRSLSFLLSITAAVFVSILSTTVSAQTPLSFERRTDVTVTDAPRAIAVADVTGDGWRDIILAGTGRGSVTVIPSHGVEDGDAGQRYRPARDYVLGGGPFDVAVGDLNRDGRLDIAVANADSDTIDLLFNQGAGNFATPVTLPFPGNPRGIALGDFNRDGTLDIAATTFATAGFDVLFGAGDGTFPTRRAFGAPVNPQGMAVADFNRDGWNDVAVASASGVIRVYEMFATGAVIRDINPSGNGWNVIAASDLDGDSRVDLAVASTGSSLVHLLYNRASGWAASPAINVGPSPRGIAIADLNQDGKPEVVTAGRAASTFTVITRAADGTTSTADFSSGTGSRAVALGDFENDGRIGVATANEFGRSFTVNRNATDFGPAPAFAFDAVDNAGWFGTITGVADFNENGIFDLVADNRVVIDGTASQRIDPLNGFIRAARAVDVNSDGHQDVLASGNQVVIPFFGDGRGGFTRGPATAMTLRDFGFTPADMNRDGRVDLVVRVTEPRTSAAIEVWLGRGDGSFTRANTRPVSTDTGGAIIADLDRDARLDAAFSYEGGLLVLLGDGNGGFKATKTFGNGLPFAGPAFGDFTADGIPDLVAGEMEKRTFDSFSFFSSTPRIAVARGVGDGTFEALHTYDVTPEGGFDTVFGPQLVDLNADGALDIFTDRGHWLKGSNTGDFQPPERFAVFGGGTIVDINHDSLPDLVGFNSRHSGSPGAWLNTRRTPSQNRVPTGFFGFPDEMSWNYETWWYAEDETGFYTGPIQDADLHDIRYTWTINGKVSGHFEFWGPEAGTLPGRYNVTVTIDDYRGGSITDSFVVVVTPFKETVLLPAEDADRSLHGAWRVVDDPGGSYFGRAVTHANAGAPKQTTPLANPTDYFDMGFVADPTQEYKLWVRLKAENDNWANDSVFVQFTGAKDAAGNPLYEIGTTSALAVNLEECSGCGVSGWGWEDDGWGAVNVQGVTLRFPEGGPQTIRIQTREDGVSVDAVVLSAQKYRTTRPGTAKNDTTKLQHQGPWVMPFFPR